MSERELNIKEVTELLKSKGISYCDVTLRSMYKKGEFPYPIRHSPKKLRWTEAMIEEWREKHKAERQNGA